MSKAPEASAYAKAGVNLDAWESVKDRLGRIVSTTQVPRVVSDFGSFGGIFDAAFPKMEAPCLVASVDSVGTKVMVGSLCGSYRGLGLDITNHCVNDILVQGARPLFFLDYIAMDVLDQDRLLELVEGLAQGCREAGMALLGGETAELPGVYAPGEFDLVGNVIGLVDKPKALDGSRCRPGDVILGLASSGLHTSGFSLARRALLGGSGNPLGEKLADGRTLGEALLAPHKSYLDCLGPILEHPGLHGLVHITGGGYPDNIPRVVRPPLSARIKVSTWQVPEVFERIQTQGKVSREEMYRVFNMGVGMLVIADPSEAHGFLEVLRGKGESPVVLGEVADSGDPVVLEGL